MAVSRNTLVIGSSNHVIEIGQLLSRVATRES
jgi:hypothetical protein